MTIAKFETFLTLMRENWPEATKEMIISLPLIDRIQSTNMMLRNKIMMQYQLQLSDFGLLTALRRSPKPHLLTPTQLMEHMLISSGGLTKALYRLENRGMISRKASVEDGRIKLVQLTQKGSTTIEEIVKKELASHQILRDSFTDKETETLNILLTKLVNTMEKNLD